jgi:dTDP-4-dehydrorhamnose 3,5-epimerase
MAYGDHRGHFVEIFSPGNHSWLPKDFVKQVNCSKSKKGVVRGLHVTNFSKIITCVTGAIYDVVVDLRPDSPSFKKWVGTYLDAPDTQIYVPPLCGHGVMALEDQTVVVYAQNGYYCPANEFSVHWKGFGIKWPIADHYVLSEKDDKAGSLQDFLEHRAIISCSEVDTLKGQLKDAKNEKLDAAGNTSSTT